MTEPLRAVKRLPKEGVVEEYIPTPKDLEQTPYLMADLSTGAQIFIWSIRKSLQIRRIPGKFEGQILEAHKRIRVPEASESIEECMALLATGALRTVIVECPCKTHLSSDELLMLNVCRALQSGHDQVAQQLITRLFKGRLGSIYCRSARDYADALSRAGLPLKRITKLKIAEG